MTLGTLIFVMAWTSFLQPNNLASGGLTGLTTILDYATQGRIPMDFTYALINVLLLVAGFLFLGKSFGFKTIYVIALSSLLFWLLPEYFPSLEVVDPNLDKIMIVLIGGAMESVGIGMILLRGGSTGGTDIVAMILNKYWPISPGKVYLYSDIFIISSLLLIPIEQGGGLVNMIYAYVMMLVLHHVLYCREFSSHREYLPIRHFLLAFRFEFPALSCQVAVFCFLHFQKLQPKVLMKLLFSLLKM